MERLLKVKDLVERYGFSLYEARQLMLRVERTNIGMGSTPRWVTTASAVEAYLDNRTEHFQSPGLDRHGKLIRR